MVMIRKDGEKQRGRKGRVNLGIIGLLQQNEARVSRWQGTQ